MSDAIKFPVGKFQYAEPTQKLRQELVDEYRKAPGLLRKAVSGLNTQQLLTPYREGGWTAAQVVHHIAESDVNSYPRLKYALTESNPTILVAQQDLWAELPDAKSPSIEASLLVFEAIRIRWAEAWLSLKPSDYERKWTHPRYGLLNVDYLLQQYAWHARHHNAQITTLRKQKGW